MRTQLLLTCTAYLIIIVKMNHSEIARKLFNEGYSCSQAVAGAFAEKCQMSLKSMLKISIAFGGGFLHSRDLCGALSGAGIVLGILFGDTDPDGKIKFRNRFEGIVKAFSQLNGSTNCRVLLDSLQANISKISTTCDLTENEREKRPCLKYVLDCVTLIEEFQKCKCE